MTIYLYVKQCNHCGLKYFGKTNGKNSYYLGGGKYWLRHIKKHGNTCIDTIENYLFDSQEEATKFAIDFSHKHDIVNSDMWANLMVENALTGRSTGFGGSIKGSRPKSQSWCEQHSDNMNGKNNPRFGYKYSEEEKLKHRNLMLKYYADKKLTHSPS